MRECEVEGRYVEYVDEVEGQDGLGGCFGRSVSWVTDGPQALVLLLLEADVVCGGRGGK